MQPNHPRRAGIAVVILAVLLTLFGFSHASADGGTHHPDCWTVKDQPHTKNTEIAGTVYIKAGNQHYNVGFHPSGWDVPAEYNGHDTSHYDICGEETPVTTTTTTIPVTTTTEPIPTTTEPVPTTTEPIPTTTEPVPTTTEPTTTTEPLPTTTAPTTTAPTTGAPRITSVGDCDSYTFTWHNEDDEAHTFAWRLLPSEGYVTVVVPPGETTTRFVGLNDGRTYSWEAWIISDPSYPRALYHHDNDGCIVPTTPAPASDIGTPPAPATVAPPVVPGTLPQTGMSLAEMEGFITVAACALLIGGLAVWTVRRSRVAV